MLIFVVNFVYSEVFGLDLGTISQGRFEIEVSAKAKSSDSMPIVGVSGVRVSILFPSN